MQRYDFATKWASVVLGIGAVFVFLGLSMSTDQSGLVPDILVASRFQPAGYITPLQNLEEVIFSLFFYGGLLVALGISVLFFQRFRKHKTGGLVLLENQLD